MKLQSLAVIFVIIILPISIIISSYTGNQIKTISLQTSYDSKLNTATYDAIKAYQINSLNDSTSDAATSKIRDIEASVDTFFNSVSENFKISEGDKESIKYYVPALVYTMYDGFYIYTPLKNVINIDNTTQDRIKLKEGSKYQDGEKMYGLKPYVYYSCRYKTNDGSDFVITYSLDNYITIQGKVGGEDWNIGGYLLDGVKENNGTITYNGIGIDQNETINNAQLKENILDENINGDGLPYRQINGTKYYYNNESEEVFSIVSGEKKLITNSNTKSDYQGKIQNNDSAYNYYKLAKKFTDKVRSNDTLKNLSFKDAYTEDGKNRICDKYNSGDNNSNISLAGFTGENNKIFAIDNNNLIEDASSNFNEHRTAVIRYTLQRNLSVAITNFNNYTDSSTDFQMPTLSETDWYSIINNISMISFMQGISIGGKMYNGYSVVVNNKNKEVVEEGSIYITTKEAGVTTNQQYHKVNSEHIKQLNENSLEQGVFNINFERRSFIDRDTLETKYYYPKNHFACYECIVNNRNGVEETDILKYVKGLATSADSKENNIAKLYYMALGRERYSMNRTTYDIYANNLQENESWKYCKLTT